MKDNSRTKYDLVASWADAAEADGWEVSPLFPTEDVSRAALLKKEGFEAQVITRENDDPRFGKSYEGELSVWGPDDLCIDVNPSLPYSMAALRNALKTCQYCHSFPVSTQRVGFASRCCAKCLPTVRPRVEFPGWCD